MKQRFVFVAKDSDGSTLSIEVKASASRAALTVAEQRNWKDRLKNAVHDLMRGQGYSVSEIRQRK